MTYVEKRAALGWRLIVVAGVGPVVALVAAIGLGEVNDVAQGLVGAALVYLLIGVTFLYRNWPTEIRLDDDKVHIGSTAREVRVTHQNRGAFECSWRGVTDIRVVTDPGELKRIRRSRELFTLSNHWGKPREVTRCMLGVLTAPLMRAALVVELYPGDATFPATRPAWFFPNQIGRPFRVKLAGYPSATWVAPTRRPEALARYLTLRSRDADCR
jgi:hypothetical protein